MTDAAPVTAAPPRKKRRGCLIAVLVSIAVIIAAIGGFVFLVFNSTKGVVKESRKFAAAVVAGEKETAWSLTSTGFREATSRDTLDALIDRLAPAVQGASLKNQGRSIATSTGSPSTGVATFEAKGGAKTVYFRVSVIKQSGEWKVQNFQSSEKPLDTEEEEDGPPPTEG